MWYQFFLENAHFALNLFVALVFFACFWLYFDAWLGRRGGKPLFRILGFLLLSVSFVIHATFLESSILTISILGGSRLVLEEATRLIGYLFLITGLWLDPLQLPPGDKGKLSLVVFLPALTFSPFLYPVLAVVVALLYLRRATIGLEKHLKPPALAFFVLSLAELLGLASVWRGTANVSFYKLIAPFGLFWIIENLVLLAVVIILGRWIFGYLLKRFETQFFIIFATTILVVFLLTAVSFTALLLNNLREQTLGQIETDAKVLSYTLDSKKGESLSDAQVVAQNSIVASSLANAKKGDLATFTQDFLLGKKESTLIVVNSSGQVVARGEDKEQIGDSLSDDPIIKKALGGNPVSSVIVKSGVLAPEVHVRSAAPVISKGKTVGAVMSGLVIDNAFVDGINSVTGLTASVYGDNVLSATTLTTANGKDRPIGIKEESANVKTTVLDKGENFSGTINLLNSAYFASFLPLKDVEGNPVGMLFVGKPQIFVLQLAARSIELTFITTVILLILSIFPAYFISKYIAKQLE